MRTCAGTNSHLHLIEPFGFIFDEKRIKRSTANYIDKVQYTTYLDYNDFLEKNNGELYFFTRYATKSYDEIDFSDTNKKNIFNIWKRKHGHSKRNTTKQFGKML